MKRNPMTIERVLNQIETNLADYKESLDIKDESQRKISLERLEQWVLTLKQLNKEQVND